MKNFIQIVVLFLFIMVVGCATKEQPKESKDIDIEVTKKVSEDGTAKSVASLGIEGMTCAIGCAAKIQETIGVMDGVISCNVAFEEKEATVEYDDAKISEKDMISTIEKLHDGQYKVTHVKIEKTVIKEDASSENTMDEKEGEEINRKETSEVESIKFLRFPNVFAAITRLYKY